MTVHVEAECRPEPEVTRAAERQPLDEHPSVVLRDISGRRRPNGHVIAFANEKGGVGKSTLAFHCALALEHLGKRVLTVDCDRRQQTLHHLLDARDGTVRTLNVRLPQPKHLVLDVQSGALLLQEIDRVGRDCDYVLVDLAGQDSATARRAIALADTVVTPLNASPADLDALGSVSPISHSLRRIGPFARMVIGIREELQRFGLRPFDWVVVNNRVRQCERRLLASADRSLTVMAESLGFRIVPGLTERLAYRELLTFGISHLDLKLIPGLDRMRNPHSRELLQLIEGLRLPETRPLACAVAPRRPRQPGVSPRVVESYRSALFAATPVRAPVS